MLWYNTVIPSQLLVNIATFLSIHYHYIMKTTHFLRASTWRVKNKNNLLRDLRISNPMGYVTDFTHKHNMEIFYNNMLQTSQIT